MLLWRKIAEAIELSFDIPESEKKLTQEIISNLESLKGHIGQAIEHLDKIYQPFQKYTTISTEKLIQNRGVLNRYKQQIKSNFENVKKIAFFILQKMQKFQNDGQIAELTNAFRDEIEQLEKKVEKILSALDNFRAADFRDELLKSIEAVQEEQKTIDNLIQDRLIQHLNVNILAQNWTEPVGKLLQQTIEPHTPALLELYQEREKAVEQHLNPQQISRSQTLSPALTQQINYSGDRRTHPGSE